MADLREGFCAHLSGSTAEYAADDLSPFHGAVGQPFARAALWALDIEIAGFLHLAPPVPPNGSFFSIIRTIRKNPMNRPTFLAHARRAPFGGRLKQRQIDGMNAILDEWERRQSTARWSTSRWAAELGYDCMELSARDDFLPWWVRLAEEAVQISRIATSFAEKPKHPMVLARGCDKV